MSLMNTLLELGLDDVSVVLINLFNSMPGLKVS